MEIIVTLLLRLTIIYDVYLINLVVKTKNISVNQDRLDFRLFVNNGQVNACAIKGEGVIKD